MNISKIQTYGSVLLLLATLLALPASALAQTAASFRGTLRDQSGAAVPGAPVVLMNERTGEQRTGTTTADGMYVVTNLKPSLDTIRVILDSFAPLEYTWLELAAGQEFHLDLELRPAGVTETVTVQGEATTIHLSSAAGRCRSCTSRRRAR
jgi:hypothetical protein